MEDRVGEVLAARASLERGGGVAIVVAVLLHAAVVAAGVYAAWHSAPPKTADMVNITFVKMPSAISMPAAAPSAKTATPVAPPVAKPQPKTPPAAVTPPPAPVTTKPVEKNTAAPGLFGRSTKKPSEAAPPAPVRASAPATATMPPGVTDTAAIPIGGSGVSGLEGDFRDAIYVQNMTRLIGTHWLRPPGQNGITVKVYFVIDRSGAIRDAKIETPSGNGTFDRAALRAILETASLPPLPYTYSGTSLGVHLIFK